MCVERPRNGSRCSWPSHVPISYTATHFPPLGVVIFCRPRQPDGTTARRARVPRADTGSFQCCDSFDLTFSSALHRASFVLPRITDNGQRIRDDELRERRCTLLSAVSDLFFFWRWCLCLGGNQREQDRQKALKKAAAGAKGKKESGASLQKRKEADAAALREKQAVRLSSSLLLLVDAC